MARPNEPEFCFQCGKRVIETATVTEAKDRFDGTPRVWVRLVCPDWPLLAHRPWSVGFFSQKEYSKVRTTRSIGFDPGRAA